MAEPRGSRADFVQSVEGLGFLLGLVILGLPIIFQAGFWVGVVEVVAGILVMGLSGLGAREATRQRAANVYMPAVATGVLAGVLLLVGIIIALPFAHRAALVAASLLLLVTSLFAVRALRASTHAPVGTRPV